MENIKKGFPVMQQCSHGNPFLCFTDDDLISAFRKYGSMQEGLIYLRQDVDEVTHILVRYRSFRWQR